MLASTFFDLVLGIDIHFEMVPMPAPTPTPIPNPFVGMVFDPLGLLIGQAIGAVASLVSGAPVQGPVLINSMPATTVGTLAINALGVPHILIPPGTAWTPMPKLPKPSFKGKPPLPGAPVAPEGDAISVFGSENVTLMGLSAVRLGDLSMSCGEPVRLPSSVVIAIPKGRPVMIGGPPALSLMAAGLGVVRSKWFAGHLHDLLSRMKPGRLRNFFSKAVCFLTGHPVDVATGRVLTGQVDWELPGPLPLKFERNYSSAWANRAGPLGHGWSHSLDQAVWVERGRVVYLDGEGRELEIDTFDCPDHLLPAGESLFDPRTRLTLRALGGRRYEITNSDGLTHSFAPVASAPGARAAWSRLTHVAARDGRGIALEYDTRGNLAWVHDSAGRAVAFEHDAEGRLVAVKLPHPTEDGWQTHTRYVYDQDGDLVRVVDPLRNQWRFQYRQHLLVQETNRNDLSFYFAYDGHGEDACCVRTWGDGGIYDHVIDYDKVGRMTCVTNSLGQTTAFHMNAVGCVVKVVDALGATTAFEYDERTLWRRKRTDADGGQTCWEYDARGNVLRMVAPDGGEVRVEVDEHDQPRRATDAVGGEWRWKFDADGRPVGRADPLDRRMQFRWEEAAAGRASAERSSRKQLVCMTDPAGQETTLAYDRDGNVVAMRAPDATENRWRYDRLGRCVVAIDARGNEQRREYDGLGRLVRLADADGRLREMEYDAEGQLLCARDQGRETRYTYQGMGQVRSRTEDQRTVGFAYDSEERLIAIANQHLETHRFTRGPTGQIVAETGFDGGERRYRRDPMGRVIEVARAGAVTTRYAYDRPGRIVAVEHADGSAQRYRYRLDGALIEASNETATVSFARDVLGRLLRETVTTTGAFAPTASSSPSPSPSPPPAYWVASSHDSLGHRVRVQSSHGLDQRIDRDAVGRTVGLAGHLAVSGSLPGPTWEARIDREPLGLEIERQLPGGVVASWRRDDLGRPIAREVASPAAPLQTATYGWEVDDRLRAIADVEHGVTQFQHDPRGHLAAATYEDGRTEFRAPDAVGNLFRAPDRSDRRYAAGQRVVEARDRSGARSTYSYDAEGKRARRRTATADGAAGGEWSYRWTGAGLLREVVRPDGEAVTFTYDALGRRLSKTYRGRTIRFAWDGDVPIHEWAEEQGATATAAAHEPPVAATTWLFEPETFTPVARGDGQGWRSIVTDHVGAPSALYDEGGAKVWSATLDIYGDLRRLEGTRDACPFRWPGQYEDGETGLYYNRFRAYDPEVGQYLSPDPLGAWRCFETYLYVDDPLIAIDPYGLADEPVTHMIRVQIQRGTANLASVAVERTRPITVVEVERAMMQTIVQLEEAGYRDLVPAAHGAAASLSKQMRAIANANAGGISDGRNILRRWLRGADQVRFDIENRGNNLLTCK